MLTEEIEKEIRDAIEVIVTGPVDQNIVSDELHSPWAAIVGFEKAAAAIAKRLSEGVVWQDIFRAEVEQRGEELAFDYVILRKDDSVIRSLMRKGIKDGQLAQVTVKIVEGTKDES